MGSIVIVQKIVSQWTKTSRGGENAVKRNSVPQVAPIPMNKNTTNLSVIQHSLMYLEEHGFDNPFERTYHNPDAPLNFGCIHVTWEEDVVIAQFQYSFDCGGQPERNWAQHTFQICEGEWGQVMYNGRFMDWDDGHWYYRKVVINTGLFEQLSGDVFTRNEPNYRFSAMGHLF